MCDGVHKLLKNGIFINKASIFDNKTHISIEKYLFCPQNRQPKENTINLLSNEKRDI